MVMFMQSELLPPRGAPEICKKILDLDHSIFYIAIISPLGTVMWESFGQDIPEEVLRMGFPEEIRKYYAEEVAIVLNFDNRGNALFGESKFILLGYHKIHVMMIPVADKNYTILALMSVEGEGKKINLDTVKLLTEIEPLLKSSELPSGYTAHFS
jgi:hypothetical protein